MTQSRRDGQRPSIMSNSSREVESSGGKYRLIFGRCPAIRFLDVASLPRRRACLVLCGILVLSLWVTLHPYHGVIHDARLYAVQALRILDPEAYRNDLYFK